MNFRRPDMIRAIVVLLLTAMLSPAPAPAQTPDDTRFYSVSYIEVNPSSRSMALTSLRRYRDVSHKDSAHIRTELFEQADRPGHFVIVETWKTQAAFDANGDVRKQLVDAIQPVRLSDWDTRPYKTLSVPPGAPEADDGAIVVITHVDVSPDPKVAPLLTTLAEASRRESGNLRFDVLLHTMRANHFEVIEIWKNQKALDSHAAAEHTRKYRDDLQQFLGSPLDERLFKSIK
jgi:quinol monooxygenase YgiN